MRLTTNRILNRTKANPLKNMETDNSRGYSKLKKQYYGPKSPALEQAVNEIINTMSQDLDSKLRRRTDLIPKKSNLSATELEGLKWLEKQTRDEKISILEADKGGAILIVYPSLLKKKTLEKLEDPSLYEKLPEDPTQTLHKELFNLWVEGKENSFVSPKEAKEIMCISNNPKSDGTGPTNRPSTLPHFKPGISYFYPSLKIHKLEKDLLKPGVEPPVRLITALQDGVSKRSDVFIAENYLRDLEKDYCGDLLQDNTDALVWLDSMEKNLEVSVKSKVNCFTYDFKALYDSLSPNLVLESLKEATEECRPEWSTDFVEWLLKLVDLSLKSSVGIFEGNWYKQRKGVPTGGSLCVQLANITVFSIMRRAVYGDEDIMKNVISAKRYIDDGAGLYNGSIDSFKDWIASLNEQLSPFGLNIDESTICPTNDYISFLDIQFCFDDSGNLQTDLYTKPTDSRAYLNFNSAHPSHTFSGIVHSGCFRLRKIINNHDRLERRLKDLGACFKNAGYPESLTKKAIQKALTSERCLKRKSEKTQAEESVTPSIRVVSTYGSDIDLVSSVKRFASSLSRTRSFSESDIPDTEHLDPLTSTPTHRLSVPSISAPHSRSPSPNWSSSRITTSSTDLNSPSAPIRQGTKPESSVPKKDCLFQFVKKTGASIRSRLVKLKNLALGRQFSRTEKCGSKNCKCCRMVSEKTSFAHKDSVVKTVGGSCSSYNIIYVFECKLCCKRYVGRSTRHLRTRVGEHRRSFYKLCDLKDFDEDSDEYALGLHLFSDHNLKDRDDFDKNYTVALIDFCSPKILDVKEHKFIHILNTLKPHGLNLNNPFSIPLLYR